MSGADGNHRPVAVVVGLEGNGLGVSRALHQQGLDCIAVGVPGWQAAYSTNSCRVVRCESWTEEGFIDTLMRVAQRLEHKAPLLITKDEPVLWVSKHREKLASSFEIRLPPPATVDLMMSKVEFLEYSHKEGWPVPVTITVNDRSDLDAQLLDVPYPCILKPAVKNSEFRKYSPAKAYRIASEEELLDRYDFIAQWEQTAVIQEWIPGGDEQISYCLACYSAASEPLGLFAGRKLRQFPIDCGNTAIAAPAPEEWRESILQLSQKIFSTLKYQGIGSIEYKMRPDGTPVIMEPTVGRTNWQNEVAVLNGIDIPALAYYDMIGAEKLPEARTVTPCKLVDGRAHRRAFYQLHRSGRLSIPAWLRERSGRKRYMMWRLDDPRPFLSATVGKWARIAWHLPMRVVRKLYRLLT